jgi:hypothetical protein
MPPEPTPDAPPLLVWWPRPTGRSHLAEAEANALVVGAFGPASEALAVVYVAVDRAAEPRHGHEAGVKVGYREEDLE